MSRAVERLRTRRMAVRRSSVIMVRALQWSVWDRSQMAGVEKLVGGEDVKTTEVGSMLQDFRCKQ